MLTPGLIDTFNNFNFANTLYDPKPVGKQKLKFPVRFVHNLCLGGVEAFSTQTL